MPAVLRMNQPYNLAQDGQNCLWLRGAQSPGESQVRCQNKTPGKRVVLGIQVWSGLIWHGMVWYGCKYVGIHMRMDIWIDE